MNFIKQKNKNEINTDTYPAFGLFRTVWDDYGIKCEFILTYYSNKNEGKEIGRTKIIFKENPSNHLFPEFDGTDSLYISLGQELSFYKNLVDFVGTEKSIEVLEQLNDIAWQSQKIEPFESDSKFRNALLRDNSARDTLRFGKQVILNEPFNKSFSFKYTTKAEDAEQPFTINVDFDETDPLPHRIVGIIGRNAVGKTHLMGSLARDLVQVRKVSQKSINQKEESFSGDRPIFNRVITISYSAFDRFVIPTNPQNSYVYCGIRNSKGALSRSSLVQDYRDNIIRIQDLKREELWVTCMSHILENHNDDFANKLRLEVYAQYDSEEDTLSLLSSGQSILAHFVTALVARIQENTLVLFDEPETHLHPNAVAHLFNVLNRVLIEHQSFAIIATHSPIVIQEIPKKRVILLSRDGNNTSVIPMHFETFGESISELTRHVFDTVSIPHYYKKVLKRLAQNMSFEEVDELFEYDLGLNARSYLLSQYGTEQ